MESTEDKIIESTSVPIRRQTKSQRTDQSIVECLFLISFAVGCKIDAHCHWHARDTSKEIVHQMSTMAMLSL